MIELVKRPIFTEKSVRLIETNQYTFDVDLRLTKSQIKRLVKDIFQVNVLAVNTHRPPRRERRLGMSQGHKAAKKRVIITIQEGQSLNVLSND